MKSWSVCDDGMGCVWVRAETRNKARAYWPGDTWDFEVMMRLRVRREPRLDGPGPRDYLETVWVRCDCGEPYGCGACFDGDRFDMDATVAALESEDAS